MDTGGFVLATATHVVAHATLAPGHATHVGALAQMTRKILNYPSQKMRKRYRALIYRDSEIHGHGLEPSLTQGPVQK